MLLDLIENRKSIRKYQDKKISKEDLNKILRAGYLAPSWMNSQPWKFILVEDEESKKLISELALNQPHVKNAPAVVVFLADKNGWCREEFSKTLMGNGISQSGVEKILQMPMFYPALLGEDKVLLRSVEQVTFAVAYMMLEAKEIGIDSCVIGAIYNETTVENKEIMEKVNKKLNLKENQVLVSMLTLGYSAEDEGKTVKIRKDFDEVVHFERLD